MATTINTYSVGLTLNASEYINNAALSATESRRLVRAIEAARDPAEKFTLAHDRLTKALEKGGIQQDVYNRLLDAERTKLEAAEASTQEAKDAAKAMESTMTAVNGVLSKTESTWDKNARLATEFRKALAAGRITGSEYARGLDHLRRSSEAASEGHKRLTAQIGQAQSIVRSIATPQQIYRDKIASLDVALKAGAISQQDHARAVEHSRRAMIDATSVGQRFNESFRSARSIIDAAETSAERYARQMRDLERALKHGKVTQDEFARGAAHLRGQMSAGATSMSLMIAKAKALAAAYLGVRTLTKSINLAVNAEQAAASFEILTGSVEGSRDILRDLREFATRSPITFVGAQDAAKMMMAFNIPVQEVMHNIKMLGDISMGNQQRFDSLTLAFSQMSATGKLMGQELMQMANAGFNPLQEISRKTGESIMELRERMAAGEISVKEVRDAFTSATSEGGKYHGMMDSLADTMGGKLSVAMSNLEQAGAQLGQAVGPLVIALTDGFNEGQSAIQGAIWLVEKFADGVGFVTSVLKDMWNAAANLDFDAEWNATNKFLDAIEQRERERKQAAADAVRGTLDAAKQVEGVMSGMGEASPVEEAFQKRLENLRLQVVEFERGKEVADRMRMAAEGYNDAQIKQIQAQERIVEKLQEQAKLEKESAKDREKAARDKEREIEKLAKAADDAFAKSVEQALAAARRHFDDEAKRAKQMRAEISKGPGAGMELGSAEAVRFMADQRNAQIGAAAIPERPTPGEDAIRREAEKQFIEMQKQSAKQDQMLATLRESLSVARNNGFKRIR
jgi:tape measure domain-containing protein